MNIRFILIICFLLCGKLISSEAEIREFAKKQFPNDYTMQKYVFENQYQAYQFMNKVADQEVKGIAEKQFPEDYTMQEYVYQSQVKSKAYMSQVTDLDVKKIAQNQFPDDYTMQEYVYKNQLLAKQEMTGIDERIIKSDSNIGGGELCKLKELLDLFKENGIFPSIRFNYEKFDFKTHPTEVLRGKELFKLPVYKTAGEKPAAMIYFDNDMDVRAFMMTYKVKDNGNDDIVPFDHEDYYYVVNLLMERFDSLDIAKLKDKYFIDEKFDNNVAMKKYHINGYRVESVITKEPANIYIYNLIVMDKSFIK